MHRSRFHLQYIQIELPVAALGGGGALLQSQSNRTFQGAKVDTFDPPRGHLFTPRGGQSEPRGQSGAANHKLWLLSVGRVLSFLFGKHKTPLIGQRSTVFLPKVASLPLTNSGEDRRPFRAICWRTEQLIVSSRHFFRSFRSEKILRRW